MINLDRRNGSCNTLDAPSDRICIPNKTEDVNLSVFNMVTRINELKILANHILCRKRKSNQKWGNNKFQCECKNPKKRKNKNAFGILVHVLVKMVNIEQVLLVIQ